MYEITKNKFAKFFEKIIFFFLYIFIESKGPQDLSLRLRCFASAVSFFILRLFYEFSVTLQRHESFCFHVCAQQFIKLCLNLCAPVRPWQRQ